MADVPARKPVRRFPVRRRVYASASHCACQCRYFNPSAPPCPSYIIHQPKRTEARPSLAPSSTDGKSDANLALFRIQPSIISTRTTTTTTTSTRTRRGWVRERAVARRGTKGPVLMQAAALLLSRLLFITAAVGAQAATLCLPRRSQPESRYSRPDIILLYLRSERRG